MRREYDAIKLEHLASGTPEAQAQGGADGTAVSTPPEHSSGGLLRVQHLRPDLNENLYRVDVRRPGGWWQTADDFVTYFRRADLEAARAAITEALDDA